MSKWKRTVVGSVLAQKDDKKKFYIKFKQDVNIKAGDFINLESKQNQIDSIQKAFDEGKVSEDVLESALERIEKMPDFVKFDLVKLEKLD